MKLFTKVSLGGAFVMLKFDECRIHKKNLSPKKTCFFPMHRKKTGKNHAIDACTRRGHNIRQNEKAFLR